MTIKIFFQITMPWNRSKLRTLVIALLASTFTIPSPYIMASTKQLFAYNEMTLTYCTDPTILSITQTRPLHTQRVSSLLSCAISCSSDETCTHAIYRTTLNRKVCLHIQLSEKSTLSQEEWIRDDQQLQGCFVLLGTKRRATTDNSTGHSAGWKILTPSALTSDGYSSHFWAYKFVRNTPLYCIRPVTPIISQHGLSQFIFLVGLRMISHIRDFASPFQLSFTLATVGDATGKWTKTETRIHFDGSVANTEKSNVTGYIVGRSDFNMASEKSVHIALNSPQLLSSALLNGYRPVAKGPYRSRALIDPIAQDVHLDTTGMVVLQLHQDLLPPIYFTSVKESAKTGIRYELRHQVNKGSESLPYLETEVDPLWVVDRAWAKLEPRNASEAESLLDVLKQNILEGREVRMVMGGEISTDIITATITPGDVIFTLTEYLTPFKGSEIKDTVKVHLPVFGVKENTLVECEMEYQTDDNSRIHETTYIPSIDWYVSLRNWTKVFEISRHGEILHGDLDGLINATNEGHNVRVCIYHADQYPIHICHGSTSIHFESGMALLQSTEILELKVNNDYTFKTVYENCAKSVRLISTDGTVKSARFVVGSSQNEFHLVAYNRQSWFVEYP